MDDVNDDTDGDQTVMDLTIPLDPIEVIQPPVYGNGPVQPLPPIPSIAAYGNDHGDRPNNTQIRPRYAVNPLEQVLIPPLPFYPEAIAQHDIARQMHERELIHSRLVANLMVTSPNFRGEFMEYLVDQLHGPPHDIVLLPEHAMLMESAYGNDGILAAKKYNIISHMMLIDQLIRRSKVNCDVQIERIEFHDDSRYECYDLLVQRIDGVFEGDRLVVCRKEDFDNAKNFERNPEDRDFQWYIATVIYRSSYMCLRIWHRDVEVRFKRFQVIKLFAAVAFHVFDGYQEVIRALSEGVSVRNLFFPPEPLHPDFTYPTDLLESLPTGPRVLNSVQRDIVNAALNQPPQFPLLINGPPGTGKTATAAAVIANILHYKRKSKLLVCTPSNAAADIIAQKLLEYGGFDGENIVRIVSPGVAVEKIDPSIHQICSISVNNRFYLPGDRKALEAYSVVICTLGSSTYLRFLGKLWFTHILIDEAGQALDMDTMIPYVLYGGLKTKLMLFGDKHQLRGFFVDGILGQSRFHANMSALERLSNHLGGDGRLCFTLLENYRSCELLIPPFSGMCYKWLVRAALAGRNERLLNRDVGSPVLYDHRFNDFPTRFHVCYGNETPALLPGDNKSFVNLDEIKVTLYYLDLCRQNGIAAHDIGVISPYRGQVKALKEQISNVYPGVTIDSVEKFQGDQRRVIIISSVRSKNIGFLKDYRRLNVAISRAESLLIVVGNLHLLCNDPHWRWYASLLNHMGNLYDPSFENPSQAYSYWFQRLQQLQITSPVYPNDHIPGEGNIDAAFGNLDVRGGRTNVNLEACGEGVNDNMIVSGSSRDNNENVQVAPLTVRGGICGRGAIPIRGLPGRPFTNFGTHSIGTERGRGSSRGRGPSRGRDSSRGRGSSRGHTDGRGRGRGGERGRGRGHIPL